MFQGLLKQSTSITVTVLVISSTDHIAGKTGLSAGLTIYASKGGATPAPITPTTVEIDATNTPGVYALTLTTTHTNTVGELQLHITGTGADPADYKWQVTARLPDDLAFPATSGRGMVVDAAGLVDANMVKSGPSGSGTAQTAKDLGASTTQTGDSYARLGAPAGASVSADVAAIKGDTGTILTDVNTGAGAIYSRLGAPAGASMAADIAAVKSDTGTTLTDAIAIKTQTDKLTFTHAGVLDANVHYVNDVKVNGNGQAGTEWGP